MIRRAVPAIADFVSSNSPDAFFTTVTRYGVTPDGCPTRATPLSRIRESTTSCTTEPSIRAAAPTHKPPVTAYALCNPANALLRASRSHSSAATAFPVIVT